MNSNSAIEDFTNVLLENQIPEKNQPFYKRWLSYYLKFCAENQLPQIDKTSLDPYIKELQSRELKEFQIKQAHHAVFLYYLMQDEKKTSPLNSIPLSAEKTSDNTQQNPQVLWNIAMDRFKTEIQLRHYSPNTLKDYGHHIRKFAEFCQWKNPSEITSFDAKKYRTVHRFRVQGSLVTRNKNLCHHGNNPEPLTLNL